jgi:hypothetical protein
MKMARASKKDVKVAFYLLRILQNPAILLPDYKEEDEYDSDELCPEIEDDPEHLKAFYEAVSRLDSRSSLSRVIWGYDTMAAPHNRMINQNKDYIDDHPRIAKAKKALQTARHELVTLHGLLASDGSYDVGEIDTIDVVGLIDDVLKDFIEEENE